MIRFEKGDTSEEQNLLIQALEALFICADDARRRFAKG